MRARAFLLVMVGGAVLAGFGWLAVDGIRAFLADGDS